MAHKESKGAQWLALSPHRVESAEFGFWPFVKASLLFVWLPLRTEQCVILHREIKRNRIVSQIAVVKKLLAKEINVLNE